MIVSVVPIGNSKGIRLPKVILKQLNITDKLELEVDDKQLVLRPVNNVPRKGWEEAYKAMRLNNEDKLIIAEENGEAFEWEW